MLWKGITNMDTYEQYFDAMLEKPLELLENLIEELKMDEE